MIFDGLDVSYGNTWGSEQGTTHPVPLSRAVAARRHAAGMDYAVLLSSRERPLALVERWPRGKWRVYLFDDRSWRTQMIDLRPHGTGMLLAHRNVRWRFADERELSSWKWSFQQTTTVSADGQVEVRSEFAGPKVAPTEPLLQASGRSDVDPEQVPVRRFPAPVEDFLCRAPEFGDWQVFVPFLAQQGHEPATAVVLSDASVDEGPGPLRATGIEQLFSPGPCDTPDGPAVVEPVHAGLLRITSGRLAVSDPGWIGEDLRTVDVPPGEFPVTLSLLRTARGDGVAAARVTILDVPPQGWEMALRPDEDLGLLGAGEFYGVGVDTGTAAFMDATRTVSEDTVDEDVFMPLDSRFTVELPGTQAEPNLIAFRAGRGDGAYPVWIGRTGDGQVGCVVVDFQLHPADGGN